MSTWHLGRLFPPLSHVQGSEQDCGWGGAAQARPRREAGSSVLSTWLYSCRARGEGQRRQPQERPLVHPVPAWRLAV